MKRILSLAAVAVLCFAAATSCKNSGKQAAESPAVEDLGTAFEEFEPVDATPIEEIEAVEEPENPDRLLYSDIEVKPKFQEGDEKAFQQWIADNVRYPFEASDNNQSGTVVAQFTVDKEGKITDVKILRSVDPILDAEAVRVIESAPSWTPASHEGEPIEVSFVLPVKFEIK